MGGPSLPPLPTEYHRVDDEEAAARHQADQDHVAQVDLGGLARLLVGGGHHDRLLAAGRHLERRESYG